MKVTLESECMAQDCNNYIEMKGLQGLQKYEIGFLSYL